MSSIPEIEAAVRKLTAEELSQFREWFQEFDARAWDEQLEQDAQAGHLDKLAKDAIQDLRQGRSTKL
jgi:hypothetical protein